MTDFSPAAFRPITRPPEQVLSLFGPATHAKRLRQIQEVTDAALAHLELDELLSALLERLRSVLAVDTVRILLCTAEGGALSVRASIGLEAAGAGPVVIPIGQGLAGRVAARREAVIVDDVSTIQTVDPAIRVLASAMVAPLLVEGRLLGVLKVGTLTRRTFSDAELSLLQMVADRAALAIDRAQRHEQLREEMDARLQAQEALHETEQGFRLLVEQVQDYAIFLLDPEGRITSWNRGAERIKGYFESEVRGRHFSLFYPPDVAALGHPENELEIATRTGRYEEEGWRIRKDGSRFWANVVITALQKGDQLVGFAKVTRDLTERMQYENQLEAQAATLTETVEELRVRSEQAEAANKAKTEFMAVMSHELRTPLNAIIGYAELLRAGIPTALPAAAQQHVERIDLAARHQLALIEEILSFARLSTGKETVDLETVDLAQIAREAAMFILPLAEQKGIALRTEVPDTSLAIRTDAGKVRQILANLLSNAVKFTPDGEIRLTIESDDERARVHVHDSGIGIAPENVNRIFHAFWQVHQGTTREFGGSGLGLSISQRIAELLGGRIDVRSTPGEGSTFSLTLPLASTALTS